MRLDMAKQKTTQAFFLPVSWLRALLGVCAVLAVAEFILHRHAYFALEAAPLFFAIFGFLAFGLIIAGSWGVAKFVTRPADYYDTPEGDA